MTTISSIYLTPQIRLIIITISSILLILSSSSNSVYAKPNHSHTFMTIYAFGNSYTDTGNTWSKTGPSGFTFVSNPPYGSTFFHHPTNRYSDGRLVIDFVAQALSLPFLAPYLDRKANKSSGINFAVAGSTAIAHSFFVKHNMRINITPQSLRTELAWFDKYLLEGEGCKDSSTTPRECGAVFRKALVWVGEMASNDYAYSYGSFVPTKTIQKLAINSFVDFLQALLRKGAKYVVVQGLPPIGCLTLSLYVARPDDRDNTRCVASANKQSEVHNTALKTQLNLLRKQYPKFIIIYADYYNAYLNVIKNARKYKFKELFKACCGYGGGAYNYDYLNVCGSPSSRSCVGPSRFVNWDGAHLTEAMYKAISDGIVNGSFSQPPFRSFWIDKHQSG
ncbi:hypothetical protein CASFOL_011394 [Castilleja foliolosa]|uniref:Uncharacterized protein n=1 Tax=Castilleja foliolosa TaxID=1961234 RepID=A0ABD3DWC9_9LAMI